LQAGVALLTCFLLLFYRMFTYRNALFHAAARQ
jgi:hypothetical protein